MFFVYKILNILIINIINKKINFKLKYKLWKDIQIILNLNYFLTFGLK